MSNTNPTFPKPPKAKRNGVMMGSDGDHPGSVPGKGYNYQGNKNGPGKWINRNGTQVGESDQEDSTIRNKKSTGDTIAPRTFPFVKSNGPPDVTTRNVRNGGKQYNMTGRQVADSQGYSKSTGDRPTTNITPMMKAARKKRLSKGGY